MASQSGDVVIAVMGMTGVGKSSFIQRVTGRKDIRIGHSLSSETEEVTPYGFQYGGFNFTIVDTPGFDDDRFDDDIVVTRILTWLKNSFNAGTRLNGLIYMHRITDPRLRGTAVSNMSMFRRLCGPDCFQNVILATTFWGLIDPVEGRKRERELCRDDRFWGRLVKKKSRVVRIENDVEGDRRLLLSIARNGKCTLAAQQEMQEGASMLETGAAQEINKNLAIMQQQYEEQFQAEEAELLEELSRRKRLAKAELDAQRLASEKEQDDLSQQARQDIEARRLAWENDRQVEVQNHARERALRDAELHRLQVRRDREKERLDRDRRKRVDDEKHYYKNYRCKRRRAILRFRCDRCFNQFDTRVVEYYHCCHCDNDNYDRCSRCGPSCRDENHPRLKLGVPGSERCCVVM